MSIDCSTQQPTEAVLVFMRAPQLGRVKTRLAKSLGPTTALRLYQAFVLDELEMLQQASCRVILMIHPADAQQIVTDWLGTDLVAGFAAGLEIQPQNGSDIGRRMASALASAFDRSFERILIIGTDLPHLPVARIAQAFNNLRDADAVLGPALDGGYYLIGFTSRGFSPEVFDAMAWSTDIVFRETLTRLQRLQRTVCVLPPLRDIDVIEDLIAFNTNLQAEQPRTEHAPQQFPSAEGPVCEHSPARHTRAILSRLALCGY